MPKLKPVTIVTNNSQQNSNYTNLAFNTKNSSSSHAPQIPTNIDENNDIDKLKYELSLREKELHFKDRIISKEKQEKLRLQEEIDFLERELYNKQQQSNLNSTSNNRACGSNDYARRRLHSTFQSSYIDPSDSQIWESCLSSSSKLSNCFSLLFLFCVSVSVGRGCGCV